MKIHIKIKYCIATMKKFSIVEFDDGLSVVPSIWLTTSPGGIRSIWPSHLKNQIRINKAIVNTELPRDDIEWPTLKVHRKFAEADSYEAAISKCAIAEVTSNVDDTNIDSDQDEQQAWEKIKQLRRVRAKRKWSSDEESDTQEQSLKSYPTKYPTFPSSVSQLVKRSNSHVIPEKHKTNSLIKEHESFASQLSETSIRSNESVSTGKLSASGTVNVSRLQSCSNQISNDDIYKVLQQIEINSTNISGICGRIMQRQKFYFMSLNQKQEEMNERLAALEKKGIGLTDDLSRQIESSLPLKNDNDLRKFESDLADDDFFCSAVVVLKQGSGTDVNHSICGILKKIITDEMAEKFNVLGRHGKESFAKLRIWTLIKRTIRECHPHTTDETLAKRTSFWLAQAKTRKSRRGIRENITTN